MSSDTTRGGTRCDGCGTRVSGARTFRDGNGDEIATLCVGCQDLMDLRDDEPSDIEQYQYVGGDGDE